MFSRKPSMKKTLKLLIPFLLLLALAGLCGWWWQNRQPAQDQSTLTLYGTIDIRDVQLAFPEQEIIEQVLVEEGNRVETGQVLAIQRSDRLQAQLREAGARVSAREQTLQRLMAGTRQQEIDRLRAEVEAATTRMDNARRRYERIRTTTRKGASTEQTLDDARAAFETARAKLRAQRKSLDLAQEGPRQEDIKQARAELEAARAARDLLQIRIEDLKLRSPSAGVIQSRILEPGAMALPNTPVLSLALDDPKWVRAYVPEPDLGFIREGLPASIQSDSFPEQRFQGWVGFISPVAEFTPKNVETTELRTRLVYEVRIQVKDPEHRLRLGMPVTVHIDRDAPAQGSWYGSITSNPPKKTPEAEP